MKTEILALTDLTIYEAEPFRRAEIGLLDAALLVLKDHRFIHLPGKGLSKMVDLLNWRAGARCEHIESRGIFADQAVHFAIHHVLEGVLGGRQPQTVLLAECVASASDMYLLGKLSEAGEETGFLSETIESYCSYYEMYAAEAEQLEHLLSAFLDDPFKTMAETAIFLFSFGTALLGPNWNRAVLTEMTANPYYPLVHHYNLTNWILSIRAQFPGRLVDDAGFLAETPPFLASEKGFLALFEGSE